MPRSRRRRPIAPIVSAKNAIVTSYKLIARDTVEEKILNLQKRKREMASAMLETEEPLMTGLTVEDLADLLAP